MDNINVYLFDFLLYQDKGYCVSIWHSDTSLEPERGFFGSVSRDMWFLLKLGSEW